MVNSCLFVIPVQRNIKFGFHGSENIFGESYLFLRYSTKNCALQYIMDTLIKTVFFFYFTKLEVPQKPLYSFFFKQTSDV